MNSRAFVAIAVGITGFVLGILSGVEGSVLGIFAGIAALGTAVVAWVLGRQVEKAERALEL